eukprot:CAMPEP_0197035866 /NCGR_PEP_ID=MMETSP1384-20130603/13536_1 /TAXON_ID=29189 /ORGANISM="Ammonia sp." /LENGTH=926 /DNA_ID=CAMNT_0042465969 /DNA_START=26 /DNA_END=2806 /DNA_ORIENTATION=-
MADIDPIPAPTDKELTSLRAFAKETLKSDVHVDILAIDKIFVLEKLKKNKEKIEERFLVTVKEPGRLLLVKSKLVGKSATDNILLITLNEMKFYVHNNEYYCIELEYNDRSKSIILCTKNKPLVQKLQINLLSIAHMLSQCIVFEPQLTAISKEAVLDKIDRAKFQLSNARVLGLAYQIFCIVESVLIDKPLLDLFMDADFHEMNHIFDVYFVLKHYTSIGAKNPKQFKLNLREVLVILHALSMVTSFTHLHLDNIPMTDEIANRLGKLLARNDAITSVALRKTQVNATTFFTFNTMFDREIVKNTKMVKKMKVLEHLTLSHNNLQLIGNEHQKKKKKKKGDEANSPSFFGSLDGNVLAARKLYLSRCNLNQELVSQIVDSGINYAYLEKIDLSFNDFQNNSIVTMKLSQFCRKVQVLQSLLLKDCKLQLTFLQDIIGSKNGYDYREQLQFLDLSGNVMTHYAANAIGTILQNTMCPVFKLDLSNITTMDHAMLESILVAPFRAPFKNIYIDLVFKSVGFDNNEYLKGLSNAIRFAQQQKNDCNGIQCIDLSANNLGSKFDIVCDSYIANFYSLDTLNLDFNFKLNKTKKGFYAPSITSLCNALTKLKKLRTLSLCGDWANNLYLTYDDLLPLLQYIANSENQCNLEALFLQGNRILDDGCKIIANSLKTNKKLKILDIEDNKCSFKGFLSIIKAIVECENSEDIKLCDIPLHSVLDDPNFKSKIKKNREKIEKCITIIQHNRELDQQQQLEQKENDSAMPGVPTMSPRLQHSESNALRDSDDDTENEQKTTGGEGAGGSAPKSPPHRYAAPGKHVANVDRLAFMLKGSAMPKLKSIGPKPGTGTGGGGESKENAEKTPPPPLPPGSSGAAPTGSAGPSMKSAPAKPTKAKLVSSGLDAELTKTTNTNVDNAKSKRKKRTRKKLDV